jgi:hypothetical protein
MRGCWNFLGIFAIAGMAALAAPTNASAAAFSCVVVSSQTITSLVQGAQTTTSSTFVDVPGASVTFDANDSSCAIVEISAQVRALYPRSVQLRVTLDGDAIIQPNFVILYTTEHEFDERAATFILRNIAGGNRVLTVQFLSMNGSPVSVSRMLTVVHRRDTD